MTNTKSHFQERLYLICLALNSLLVFFSIYSSHLFIPEFIQFTGRLHLLLLHFPIVILLYALLAELRYSGSEKLGHRDTALLAAALFASLTALAGLFLSLEVDYSPGQLFRHKYLGMAISLGSFFGYSLRSLIRINRIISVGFLSLMGIVLLWGAHEGAKITHGDNFLIEPFQNREKKSLPPLEELLIYPDLVQGFFDDYCISCHNSKKSKGKLVLTDSVAFRKGGKNGSLIDPDNYRDGHLLQRLYLPLEDEHHMPPIEKKQPSEEELKLIRLWIAAGAQTDQKLMDLEVQDSLRILISKMYVNRELESYTFESADPELILELNSNYCSVRQLADGSPALEASFFGISTFDPEQLRKLQAIKKQLVSLNLAHMPIEESDLSQITQFANLRKLNLSFTGFKGVWLSELGKLRELQELVLSGNTMAVSQLESLGSIRSLKSLHLWNTGLTDEELEAVQKKYTSIAIESGFRADTLTVKLNAPGISAEKIIFKDSLKVRLKRYIPAVELRYTLDGTEPDSLVSNVLNGEWLTLYSGSTLKARSFLPGWISSDVSESQFFQSGIKPDSIYFRQPVDKKYPGTGPAGLFDEVLGDTEFNSRKWMGFRQNPMDLVLYFDHGKLISSVCLVSLLNTPSYLLPPQRIELWKKSDRGHYSLVSKIEPMQPKEMNSDGARIQAHTLSFQSQIIDELRILVYPVSKLPSWHPGKGEKAWIFPGEIFIN